MKNYFSKGLILSFVSILFTSSLFAQIRWGVNVGYDFNDNIASFRPLTQPTNGFHLGPQLTYRFQKAESLSLTAALNYRFMAYSSTQKQMFPNLITPAGYEYKEHILSHAIVIPVRINFNFNINNDWTVFAILGPQLSYHWEKAEYVEQKQQDYPLGTATQAGGYYTPTDYLPIDITIGAGLGCQYQHFFAHLTYDQGVLNRLQEAYALGKNNTNQLFSRSLSLTLGYNF